MQQNCGAERPEPLCGLSGMGSGSSRVSNLAAGFGLMADGPLSFSIWDHMGGKMADNTSKKRIWPTEFFYTQFPSMKGSKFYLLRWVDDRLIRVLREGNKNPSTYAASFFRIE